MVLWSEEKTKMEGYSACTLYIYVPIALEIINVRTVFRYNIIL